MLWNGFPIYLQLKIFVFVFIFADPYFGIQCCGFGTCDLSRFEVVQGKDDLEFCHHPTRSRARFHSFTYIA